MTNFPIIAVQSLIVKRGKVTVLDIDRLDIVPGRTLALIGPNGAGKSTLLLTLAGLLPATSGGLFFHAKPIGDRSSLDMLRRNVAVVFQEPLLINDTVYKNVALGLKFRHMDARQTAERVEEAMTNFGIAHLAKRSAKTLSGGEAKRVSLARAFAISPGVILLDESFNSLDPPTRETIIDDLQKTLQKTKVTAILAQHDREETLRLANDVAVMKEGRIVQAGTAAEVFNQPADEFVAGFVGADTILEGLVMKSIAGLMEIGVNGHIIEASGNYPQGTKVHCCLRPEHITVTRAVTGKTSARNIFDARVEKIVRQAYFYKLILDCGFRIGAYITLPSFEEMDIREGSLLKASFKATAVHVIKSGA
jgi:tungstate transport system ATP-binding protein